MRSSQRRKLPGRPTHLDEGTIKELCSSIMLGLPIAACCDLVGIQENTFYAWIKLGREKGDGPYWEFSQRIKKAMANSQAIALKSINKALTGKAQKTTTKTVKRDDGTIEETTTVEQGSNPVWTAAAWKLERRWPKQYAANRADVAAAVSEQLDKAVKRLVEAFGGEDDERVQKALSILAEPSDDVPIALPRGDDAKQA